MPAPAGTPRAVMQRLNGDIVKALELAHVRQRLTDMGPVTRPSTREAFGKFIQAEIARVRGMLPKKP